MRCLVIGCGSIGKRHINNLLKLGIEVYTYDKDLSRLESVLKEYNIKTFDFTSHHIAMDAWIICTPPNVHTYFAFEALDHNAHIFIEKPISNKIDGIEELIRRCEVKKKILMIGYQLRYNQGLQHIKRIIESNELGRLLSIRAEYGNYLPNWHKDEDYRKLYTGHKNEGGGIVLDASHEIDYMHWLVGSDVIEIKSMHTKASNLDIDVEDTADILLRFSNNIIGNIHLDMVDKCYKRKCYVIFENGNIFWNPDSLKVFDNDGEMIEGHTIITFSTSEYLLEMQSFINAIKNNDLSISNSKNALETLKICLQILNQ